MSQLRNSFGFHHSSMPAYDSAPVDLAIREAEARVREQEAHVLRLIVQGAPTQMAEDVLRQLMATARAMRERQARR